MRGKIHKSRVWLLGVFMLLLGARIAAAQLTTATITGTVSDQTGALLPGADVAINNLDTGISRLATSDETGRYEAPNLPLGNYEVRVTLPGFQTSVRAGIALTVGRTAVVDHVLQVGEVSQSVVVTAEAVMVETTTATVSNLVDATKVEDLPLNNRDLTQLTYLQVGVLRVPRTGGGELSGMGEQITVAGARGTQNLFLLDGVSNSDFTGNPQGASSAYTGAETVREFQIITNNYSAEYRSAAGAIVSAVTKSGTNALHGSLFHFLRNDNLDAARWEFNKNATPGAKKPEFRRNQFGGSLGGPIIRDRTFFFGSYEGTRQNEGALSLARVPDMNTRSGLVSITSRTNVRNPDGSCLPLEQITVNPIMPRYLALWPEPGKGNAIVPEIGAPRCDGTVQISGPGHTETTDDYFAGKIDHQFASQAVGYLSGTYNYNTGVGGKSFGLLTDVNGNYTSSKKHVIAIRHNSIFSNNFLNEFNFGYSWTKPHAEIPTVNYDWTNLKFMPHRERMGSLSPGDGVSGIGHAHADSIWQLGTMTIKEGMSLTRGDHSMRWGFELNRNAITTFGAQDGYNGEYGFATLRDFLAGSPDNLAMQVQLGPDPVRHIKQLNVGTYFQDNYRVRPSLTLNLGLRHEFATLPNEREGKLSNLVNFFDTEVTVGKFYTQATLLSFSPRFGFAWAPGDKRTSLRGGYGIFYEQPGLYHYRTPLETAAPFIQQTSITAADLRQVGTTLRFPDAFQTQRDLLLGVAQIWTMEYDMKNTYVQRWSLTLQREIGSSWVVAAGYTGSRGVHLWVQMEDNVNKWCTANATATACDPAGPRFPDHVEKKFWPQISGTDRLNPVLSNRVRIFHPMANSFYHGLGLSAQKRLSHGLTLQSSYTYSKTIDDGAGIVGGDNLTENQRGNQSWDFHLWRGLSSMDLRQNLVLNFSYVFPQTALSGVLGGLLNNWQMNGIWTATSGSPRSVSDTRTAAVRDRIGVSTGNRANIIPGGNKNPTSGTITQCQMQALNANGTGRFNSDGTPQMVNRIPDSMVGKPLGGPDLYFDPCQFVPSTPGFYGNSGRNIVIGPGFNTFDWSLFKELPVNETHRVQFRAEFFNIFNRVNFSSPSMGILTNNGGVSTTAGQINSTRDAGRSRQIQFGLKYTF
jgi:hypothetical protein